MHKPIAITPQNSTTPRMISLRHVCQNEFMRHPLPGQGPPPYWHVVREFARCCFGSGAGGGKQHTREVWAPRVESQVRRRYTRLARKHRTAGRSNCSRRAVALGGASPRASIVIGSSTPPYHTVSGPCRALRAGVGLTSASRVVPTEETATWAAYPEPRVSIMPSNSAYAFMVEPPDGRLHGECGTPASLRCVPATPSACVRRRNPPNGCTGAVRDASERCQGLVATTNLRRCDG